MECVETAEAIAHHHVDATAAERAEVPLLILLPQCLQAQCPPQLQFQQDHHGSVGCLTYILKVLGTAATLFSGASLAALDVGVVEAASVVLGHGECVGWV